MKSVLLTSAGFTFTAMLEHERAPATCEWLAGRLPMRLDLLQAAWSGLAVFADLKGAGHDVPFEKPTSYPVPGEVIFFPGNATGNTGEIYIPYGGNRFACPTGQLAGNVFLTIEEGLDQLPAFGRYVRHRGAQQMVIEAAAQG